MALLDFIKEMNLAINSNMYTAVIFMDLIKDIRYICPWYFTAKAMSLLCQKGIQLVVYKLPFK